MNSCDRYRTDINTVVYPLCRRASTKDIVESLGVPHTEIGRIILDEQEVGFATIPEGGERFQVHPLSPHSPPTVATHLRPEPIATVIFLVDINVGRLAGLLRMIGIDAELVGPGIDNATIIQRAVQEGRIISWIP